MPTYDWKTSPSFIYPALRATQALHYGTKIGLGAMAARKITSYFKKTKATKSGARLRPRRTYVRPRPHPRKRVRITKKKIFNKPKMPNQGKISFSRFSYKRKGSAFTNKLLARIGSKSYAWNGGYKISDTNTGNQMFKNFRIMDGNHLFDLITRTDGSQDTDNSNKLYLKNARERFTMTNATNATLKVDIYDYVPRHDLQARVDTILDPVEIIKAGFAQDSANTAFATHWNQSIFKSRKFCQQYKVLRVNSMYLEPGHTHQHTVKIGNNIPLSLNRLKNLGQISAAIEGPCQLTGLTKFVLIVCNGQPVWTTYLDDGVTTAAMELFVVRETEYTCKVIEDNNTVIAQTDSLLHGDISMVELIVDGDADVEGEQKVV